MAGDASRRPVDRLRAICVCGCVCVFCDIWCDSRRVIVVSIAVAVLFLVAQFRWRRGWWVSVAVASGVLRVHTSKYLLLILEPPEPVIDWFTVDHQPRENIGFRPTDNPSDAAASSP